MVAKIDYNPRGLVKIPRWAYVFLDVKLGEGRGDLELSKLFLDFVEFVTVTKAGSIAKRFEGSGGKGRSITSVSKTYEVLGVPELRIKFAGRVRSVSGGLQLTYVWVVVTGKDSRSLTNGDYFSMAEFKDEALSTVFEHSVLFT